MEIYSNTWQTTKYSNRMSVEQRESEDEIWVPYFYSWPERVFSFLNPFVPFLPFRDGLPMLPTFANLIRRTHLGVGSINIQSINHQSFCRHGESEVQPMRSIEHSLAVEVGRRSTPSAARQWRRVITIVDLKGCRVADTYLIIILWILRSLLLRFR